jgi:hypothetical protein
MFCHGAIWNNVPLSVGESTMGDYLCPLGLRTPLMRPAARLTSGLWKGLTCSRHFSTLSR